MTWAESDIVKPQQQKTTFILSEMLTCLCDRSVSAFQMQFTINKTRQCLVYVLTLSEKKEEVMY